MPKTKPSKSFTHNIRGIIKRKPYVRLPKITMSAENSQEKIIISDEESTAQMSKTATMDLDNNTNSEWPQQSNSIPSDADSMQLLREIHQNQCTKQDFYAFSKVVNKRFDDIEEKVSKNSSRVTELEIRLDEQEKRAAAARVDAELQKQKLLKNNVNIIGVPMRQNEDVKAIVLDIVKYLGHTLNVAEISAAYRTFGKNIIIAKFTSYEKKIQIIHARATKMIKVSDIMGTCSSGGDDIIFINNHTTPYYGRLLAMGRKLVKDKRIHSCWLSASGCKLKLVNEGKEQLFNTEKDLNDLITSIPPISNAPNPSKRLQPDDVTRVAKPSRKKTK